MPRFYTPCELTIGAKIDLPEAVAHHCQVLRLAIDDTVVLFNGTGGSYVASLCKLEKKRVSVHLHLQGKRRSLPKDATVLLRSNAPEFSEATDEKGPETLVTLA